MAHDLYATEERQRLLHAVERDGASLALADESYRNDPDVVLAAVASAPEALVHASQRLRESRRFIIEAVHRRWEALEFAPERLRADREVLRAAARWGPGTARLAPREPGGCPGLADQAPQGAAAYEGETLRLIGPCNRWDSTDAACRFARVLRGQDCSGERLGETVGGRTAPCSPGRDAGAPAAPAAPFEAALGAVRHRLVVHMLTDSLRFHVVSCLWLYGLAVAPVLPSVTKPGLLRRGSPLPAGTCSLADVHKASVGTFAGSCSPAESGFVIEEKSGSIVSIYVELFCGKAPASGTGAAGTGKSAAVWYVIEQERSRWRRLVGLRESQLQEAVKPWLAPSVAEALKEVPVWQLQERAGEVEEEAAAEATPVTRPEILVDVLRSAEHAELVQQAFRLSKETFATGFGDFAGPDDLGPSMQLTLLADAERALLLGYLVYELRAAASGQPGYLCIVQVAVPEAARRRGSGRALISWAEQHARKAKLERLRARALKLSMQFYLKVGFEPQRDGELDPDGVDVERVLQGSS